MTAALGLVPRLLAATALVLSPLCMVPTASAQPCPDIAVAFARGTAEPPGPGATGQRFVDSLRAQAAPRTVGVYGVNYPASSNFTDLPAFRMNIVDGVRDEANHVSGVVAACPQTQMVLGGYSQGAVVTALVTSGVAPAGVRPATVPKPLPADVADHVLAVVLFGGPAGSSLVKYGVPTLDVGPAYAGKSQKWCAPGDPVCSGRPGPGFGDAHVQYPVNGMADQAAAETVGRLARLPAPL